MNLKGVKPRDVFSVYQGFLLVVAIATNFLAYGLGRYLAQGKPHILLSSPLDDMIPLLPITIFIYLGCYLFWMVNYFLSVICDKREATHFILAHCLGELVCFFFFVLLPTTMIRPEISGGSGADYILFMTYQIDEPNNLLPSIHCFVSWLCWIGVRNKAIIPKPYRHASLIIAVLVCISTLTVKQHVFIDVVAGILLAELCYWLAGMIINRYFARKTASKSLC